MISESECENPNNDFLREDQLDYVSVSFHVHLVHMQKFLTVVEIPTECRATTSAAKK